MNTTSFLAATIQRIARKRHTLTLVWLGAIVLSFGCSLVFLWLMKFPGAAYVFIIMPGLVIIGLVIRLALILSRATRNPFESFFLEELKSYGPVQQNIAQIDREAAPYAGKTGSFVTQHWVISALSNSFRCMPLENIVWIYKHVTKSSIGLYGLTIPTGRSHAAQLWGRSGYCLTISSTEKGVDGLLAEISKVAPWVTQGYTEITAEAWNRRRADFIAVVDKRRQQISFIASGENVDHFTCSPSTAGLNLKSGSQSFPNTLQPLYPFDVNGPAHQDILEAIQARQGHKARALGCLALFAGCILSAVYILPLVRGIFENTRKISTSSGDIFVSLALLIVGTYYSAFGQKEKGFLGNAVFKNWWTIALFAILICIVMISFNSVLGSLLGSLGYEFSKP